MIWPSELLVLNRKYWVGRNSWRESHDNWLGLLVKASQELIVFLLKRYDFLLLNVLKISLWGETLVFIFILIEYEI